jgi:hypothetical protein
MEDFLLAVCFCFFCVSCRDFGSTGEAILGILRRGSKCTIASFNNRKMICVWIVS